MVSFLHFSGIYITCQTKKDLYVYIGFCFYRTGVTVVSNFSTYKLYTPQILIGLKDCNLLSLSSKEMQKCFPERVLLYPVCITIVFC